MWLSYREVYDGSHGECVATLQATTAAVFDCSVDGFRCILIACWVGIVVEHVSIELVVRTGNGLLSSQIVRIQFCGAHNLTYKSLISKLGQPVTGTGQPEPYRCQVFQLSGVTGTVDDGVVVHG